NLETVLNLVPSVVFVGDRGYRTSLTVRGVQGSNEDAAVAMYIDGVYVGRDVAQNVPLIDAESVQILRGPQGALYGKN
uniref:TonB-dependent receptor plug domain-containing protein n=1 Tax=Staphylococcus aureus TaxID=1280 RepID=UPI0038B39A40